MNPEKATTAAKISRRAASQKRLKAMAHPLRAEVLKRLIERGPSSPSQLAGELGADTSLVSYHAKKLVDYDCAELIDMTPVAGTGVLRHVYRAIDSHLIDTGEWEGLDPTLRETLLIEFLQPTVDDFTVSAKAGMLGADDRFHITRTPLKNMDQQGLDEALEAHEECRLKMAEISAKAALRLMDSDEEAIFVSSSQGCFQVPRF